MAALKAFLWFGLGYLTKTLWQRVPRRLLRLTAAPVVVAPPPHIMEVIFTNDHTEEARVQNVPYIDVGNIADFTPRNMGRIISMLNSAERSIDAAVYLFNVKELGRAMIDAHRRGVKVRMVGCKSMAGATGTQFPELQSAGKKSTFFNLIERKQENNFPKFPLI